MGSLQQVMFYPHLGEADPGGLGACPQKTIEFFFYLCSVEDWVMPIPRDVRREQKGTEDADGGFEGVECTGVDDTGSDDGWGEASDEGLGALFLDDLLETVKGAPVDLLGLGDLVGLETGLDHVDRVDGEPHGPAGAGAVETQTPAGDVSTGDVVSLDVALDERLEGHEVGAHAEALSEQSGHEAAEDAVGEAAALVELFGTVYGPLVEQWLGGLRLKPNSNVLNRGRQKAVGQAGGCAAREKLLTVESGVLEALGLVLRGQGSLHELVDAELDGHTRTHAHQRGQGAFVEAAEALVPDQLFDHVHRSVVRAFRGTLETHFGRVEGLTRQHLGNASAGACQHVLQRSVRVVVLRELNNVRVNVGHAV
ncbi:hypothetical protein TRICI_001309 [Trichomonascus ciferrii]|uniref:Uncharacterized protein n=1 Tax=Trichomonascus ciferrii TaxID=44093 RepID=A0A642VAX8_9ASCO|nr:hypothetical protein TRICI_001309 [Trichomonascus ciferrii]